MAGKALTARQRVAAVASGVAGPDALESLASDLRAVKRRDAVMEYQRARRPVTHPRKPPPWKLAGLDGPAMTLSSSQRVPREKRETPPDALDGVPVKGDAEEG